MIEPDPVYNVVYWENGNKSYETWWLNGVLHNLNGPAFIGYNENGSKKSEIWYQNDKCHNLNGPAYICYYVNGEIMHQEWWEYGIHINKNEINENVKDE